MSEALASRFISPESDPSDALSKRLGSVCWDFAQEKTSTGVHNLHPYPARFIPQIPRALIRLFHPGDGSAVLDPFCGSGTTLVEASEAGLPAIGVDLNPLAILISKVKVTPLSRAISPLASRLVAEARMRVPEIPEIPRLDHWFLPEVQKALAGLVSQLATVEDPTAGDALKVALSRIIVRVSNQESDTRYASVKKVLSSEQVFELFLKSCEFVDRTLRAGALDLFGEPPQCRLLHRNILEVHPEEIGRRSVGLVVTSPPYPNAYEYWLYHKYRMYWLGMDPLAVKESEIGARPHYFKKDPQTEDDFERQMGQCFSLLAEVMRPGALACFLVGRSVIHGREIDNTALLTRAASSRGFRAVGTVHRQIDATRKAFNLSHARIKSESITLFLREG